MKKKNKLKNEDLRSEYDFYKLKGGVRGKYAKRFATGTNLVALAPDLAKVFPNSESVNDVLRTLVQIARKKVRKAA